MAAVLDVLKKYIGTGSRFGTPLGALKAVPEARNGSTEAQAGSTEAQEGSTGAQAGSTEAQASPAGQAGRATGRPCGHLGFRSSGKIRGLLAKHLNIYIYIYIYIVVLWATLPN